MLRKPWKGQQAGTVEQAFIREGGSGKRIDHADRKEILNAIKAPEALLEQGVADAHPPDDPTTVRTSRS